MKHVYPKRLKEIRDYWIGDSTIRDMRKQGGEYEDVADLLAEITALRGDLVRLRRDLKDTTAARDQYVKFVRHIGALHQCNDCGAGKTCGYVPEWGATVRYNCPHWQAQIETGSVSHAADNNGGEAATKHSAPFDEPVRGVG